MATYSSSIRAKYGLATILHGPPFFAVHVFAIVGGLYYGWSWSGFALAVGFYFLRMFFVAGWYHRYFSHRTFKTSRAMQFVLAVLCETTVQKGVIWWASHHRRHHKYSDLPGDVHSTKLDGFFWSHVGWILSPRYENIETSRVSDLLAYPELVWVDRLQIVPVVVYASLCFAFGGVHGLLWGFAVSTVMLWHGTFTINSLSHLFGSRRYATTDDSRNNFLLALITTGEGWHNNHHHYQSSVNQGFKWWELDVTFYILRAMAAVGLVWDLRRPPREIVEGTIAAAARDATARERVGAVHPLVPHVVDPGPAE